MLTEHALYSSSWLGSAYAEEGRVLAASNLPEAAYPYHHRRRRLGLVGR